MRKKSEAIRLSRANPRKSATEFRARRHPNLIHFQEDWLDYDGAAYVPIDDATLTAEVAEFLSECRVIIRSKNGGADKDGPFDPKRADVQEVVTALAHICNVPPGTLSPPSWLDGRTDLESTNLIACQNGLLDITTRILYEATPKFFTRTALPIEHDPDAPTPDRWLQFITEVTAGSEMMARLIQEMFGYLISNDTSQQRVFFPLGLPGSGKGTLLHMLVQLVGKRNTHSVTIESLGGNFGLDRSLKLKYTPNSRRWPSAIHCSMPSTSTRSKLCPRMIGCSRPQRFISVFSG